MRLTNHGPRLLLLCYCLRDFKNTWQELSGAAANAGRRAKRPIPRPCLHVLIGRIPAERRSLSAMSMHRQPLDRSTPKASQLKHPPLLSQSLETMASTLTYSTIFLGDLACSSVIAKVPADWPVLCLRSITIKQYQISITPLFPFTRSPPSLPSVALIDVLGRIVSILNKAYSLSSHCSSPTLTPPKPLFLRVHILHAPCHVCVLSPSLTYFLHAFSCRAKAQTLGSGTLTSVSAAFEFV